MPKTNALAILATRVNGATLFRVLVILRKIPTFVRAMDIALALTFVIATAVLLAIIVASRNVSTSLLPTPLYALPMASVCLQTDASAILDLLVVHVILIQIVQQILDAIMDVESRDIANVRMVTLDLPVTFLSVLV